MVNLSSLHLMLTTRFPGLETLLFELLPTTSGFLKQESLDTGKPYFCLANEQTEGYGQRGQRWLSSADSLTFTLGLPFSLPIHKLSLLSLGVAMSLHQSISGYFSEQVKLKWPNDLLLNGAKLSGILIESVQFKLDSCYLLIGIGINGSALETLGTENELPYAHLEMSALSDEVLCSFICDLVAGLLQLPTQMSEDREAFQANSLAFMKKHDYFQTHSKVIVYHSGSNEQGHYLGLDSEGRVLVEIGGVIKRFSSGMVSLRPLRVYE